MRAARFVPFVFSLSLSGLESSRRAWGSYNVDGPVRGRGTYRLLRVAVADMVGCEVLPDGEAVMVNVINLDSGYHIRL